MDKLGKSMSYLTIRRMPSLSSEFLAFIEKNIHFEYEVGGNTRLPSLHTTEWRILPVLIASHTEYASILELKDSDPIRLRPGETFVAPPGLHHNASKVSRAPGNSHWSHIRCDVFQGVSLFDLAVPPLVIRGRASLRIRELNDRLAAIDTAELSLNRVVTRQALGYELISVLLEKASFREDRIHLIRHAPRLTPVFAYIQENLAQPLSHALLARQAGLSPSRFHTVFHAALGTAPYAYVQKLRLQKAQQLLTRTDRTVAEIGQAVGHPDPYHFSRIFRRNFGISPAGYRKRVVRQLL